MFCDGTQFCTRTQRRLLSQQTGPAQFLSVSPSHACTDRESRVFAAPLFSYSYELLFPQPLCFDNHLRCPRGVGSLDSENVPTFQRSTLKPSKSFHCHTSEKCARNPSICHTSEKQGSGDRLLLTKIPHALLTRGAMQRTICAQRCELAAQTRNET
jgi:hypothetical protein